MPDAACAAVLLLSAGAAPGLRPLISRQMPRSSLVALMPPGASTVGLTPAFMEGFGVLTPIKGVWSVASWDMNLPTLLCAQRWVHRRQVVFHNGNVAWDVLCQTGIIAWGGRSFWCERIPDDDDDDDGGALMQKCFWVLLGGNPQLLLVQGWGPVLFPHFI
jgi:hypothetical protein